MGSRHRALTLSSDLGDERRQAVMTEATGLAMVLGRNPDIDIEWLAQVALKATIWLTCAGRSATFGSQSIGCHSEEDEMAHDSLSRVFSALSDPIRRDLVARLADGDATVSELAEPHDVTKQAVSKHLRVLEDAGLVTRTGDAHRKPVHLEADVFDLMTKWIEQYRRRAEQRYQRLDELLAATPDDRSSPPPTTSTRRKGPTP
jgi:DNA-binding transcriptional ArsR family regulator